MKQFIMTLALALSALCVANAQSAEEWLAKLDSSLGERYAMHIAVTVAEEEPLNGFFMVEGDGYYINLDVMEVYSDGKLRYEVNNQRKEVERKIFPGYVLVKMIMTDEAWYIVRNTRGVTGFVGPGSRPIPLDNAEIEATLNRAAVSIDIADQMQFNIDFKEIAKRPHTLERNNCILTFDGL